MNPNPGSEAQAIVRRYEELRGQALSGGGAPRGLGWTLFRRQGMGEWLCMVSKVTPTTPRREWEREANHVADGGWVAPVSAIPNGEIVLLLANMTAVHLSGAAAAPNPHCKQEASYAISL